MQKKLVKGIKMKDTIAFVGICMWCFLLGYIANGHH